MKISHFNNLSDDEKDQQVYLRGKYLNNYDVEYEMFDVYELDDFYVAFCYDLINDVDVKILASANVDDLPYLKKL